jgi:hypothetical protein
MKTILLISAVLFGICFTSSAQVSKKEAKEDEKKMRHEQIMSLVQNKQYEFVGRFANPPQGAQVNLISRPNFLRVNKDKAEASLPYFGRAYSGGYSSSDAGIKFNGDLEDYELIKNDNKVAVMIKFKVNDNGDQFKCTLTVNGLNSATLSVNASKKQTIRYTGSIGSLKDEQ